jgi:hypothetical protein
MFPILWLIPHYTLIDLGCALLCMSSWSISTHVVCVCVCVHMCMRTSTCLHVCLCMFYIRSTTVYPPPTHCLHTVYSFLFHYTCTARTAYPPPIHCSLSMSADHSLRKLLLHFIFCNLSSSSHFHRFPLYSILSSSSIESHHPSDHTYGTHTYIPAYHRPDSPATSKKRSQKKKSRTKMTTLVYTFLSVIHPHPPIFLLSSLIVLVRFIST